MAAECPENETSEAEVRQAPGTLRRRARHRLCSPARVPAENSLMATSIIPFSRDPDFVERVETFEKIQREFVPGSWNALVGLGGVGKSQIAIEFAYRIRETSPNTWVFWVHASNAVRFEQSYRNIANFIDIPGWKEPDANIFQLVHDWLQTGKWTVILDNVDEVDFLTTQRDASETMLSSPLISYLPRCQNGSVLITTRSKDAALKLVEPRNVVTVDPMNRVDALTLLSKKLGQPIENEQEVAELAEALEYMPLALAQAAAYIVQRQPRYSTRQYLKDFRKSDEKRAGLLQHDGGHLRRDWEAKSSILITWQLSFDLIRSIRPSAADLLALMSFYDRQGIPECLLKGHGKRVAQETSSAAELDEDDESSTDSVIDALEDDIRTLCDYSFISVVSDGTTFEMHMLIQLATRKWLGSHGQFEKWQHQSIKDISSQFPDGSYETWPQCQILLPHVKSAVAQPPPQEQEASLSWTKLLQQGADYLLAIESLTDAENMLKDALIVLEKINQAICLDQLVSAKQRLGMVYERQGRWKAATEILEQNLEVAKEKYGEEHRSTILSMVILSSLYRSQARWDVAEELAVKANQLLEKLYGTNHLDTLNATLNLAHIYAEQGRWNEAETLGEEALITLDKLVGPDHPTTLYAMAHLAGTYANQRKPEAAEKLQLKILDWQKKTIGEDHIRTLNSMTFLAAIYLDQGKVAPAEILTMKALERYKENLRPDHPSTLGCLSVLAKIYTMTEPIRWDQVEELKMQILESRRKALGPEYPITMQALLDLGYTYSQQKKYIDAEKLEVEGLEILRRTLGTHHFRTQTAMYNLSYTWKGMGYHQKAVELLREYVQVLHDTVGVDDQDYISSVDRLGFYEADLVELESLSLEGKAS